MRLSRRQLAFGMSPVLIGILVGVLIINMLPRANVSIKNAPSGKLVSVKKIFAVGEQPTLKLKLGSGQIGWWGAGQAEAAEGVSTEVSYDAHPVAIPVKVTPGSGGEYILRLNPKESIKPGSYTVTAKWGNGADQTATQTFAWGVLTVNTISPVYRPGETADIQMGVLSATGHTLCGAPVTLKVIDPAGAVSMPVIHNSPVCKGDTFVEEPDYTSTYKTGGAGHYRLILRMAESDYEMEDGFDVKNNVPFVIERTAPTRLFPPATYSSVIKITPQDDFTGTVTEELPAGFKIIDGGGASVAGNKLNWPVRMERGKAYSLKYSFKSPPQSPAFYRLSPLKIMLGGTVKYMEPRRWQMAGDAAIALVKQTVANATTTSLVITASSTAGNLLVVTAGLGSNTVAVTSITDSASNTWTLAQAATGGSGTRSEIWYAQNASTVSSVTVNVGGSLNLLVNLSEYSNVATSNALDVANGQGNVSGTSVPTPVISTAAPGELLIADGSWTAAETVTTPGGAWIDLTPPTIMSNKEIRPAYQVAGAAGSYSATWTLSVAAISSSNIVAFKTPALGLGGGNCSIQPIAFVNQTTTQVSTAATAVTTNVTSTAGNALILLVHIASPTITLNATNGVTDSAGNAWVYTTTVPNANPPSNVTTSTNDYFTMAYVTNAAAITSITVTPSASAVYSFELEEFSNIAATNPVDASSSVNAGSATTQYSSTITTTNPNDLIIGGETTTTTTATLNQASSTPASGWIALNGTNVTSANGVADYQIASATGNWQIVWTLAASHPSGAGIMAFRQSTVPKPVTMEMAMRGGKAFCPSGKTPYFWAM